MSTTVTHPVLESLVGRFNDLSEWLRELGDVPSHRIVMNPWPGTATEEDFLRFVERDKRLVELIDGTLVEKAMGFEESRLAVELSHRVKSYLDQNDLGICVGADGMMRIAPGLVRIPDLSFITWDRLPGRESPMPNAGCDPARPRRYGSAWKRDAASVSDAG